MTREELYQHVWTTPINLLSEALGLSDVGLAKTCKQMNVPRPGRGYWARLDAGEQVKKVPLPSPSAADMRQWTFDIVANRQRRADWAASNLSATIKDKSQSPVELPVEHEPLHDIAAQHRVGIGKIKARRKRVRAFEFRGIFSLRRFCCHGPEAGSIDSCTNHLFGENQLSRFTREQTVPTLEPDARERSANGLLE